MAFGKIIKLLEFPSLRQSYTYSCGATVAQAILMYYGYDEREKKLMEDLNTNQKGTWLKNLIKLFRNKNFKVEHGEGYTIKDVKKCINEDTPVIMTLQAWPDKRKKDWEEGYSNGHYVIAIGYTDKGILFRDPSSIYIAFLSYDDIEKRWHDIEYDNKVEHYLIIPRGKKSEYKKNKIIKMQSISEKIKKLAAICIENSPIP